MTSGSHWSWRRKGESPRCRLPEGWIIAVGHRDSISGSPLDPLSHMIQASHCVCQKSMSFRGMRGCRTTFALGIFTLGNLSKYPKLVLLPYVRSRSSLSLLHLVSSVVGSRTCSDWLCTLIFLQWITQNKLCIRSSHVNSVNNFHDMNRTRQEGNEDSFPRQVHKLNMMNDR